MSALRFVANHWLALSIAALLLVGVVSNPVLALTLLRRYWQYLLAAALLFVAYQMGFRTADRAAQASIATQRAVAAEQARRATQLARDAEQAAQARQSATEAQYQKDIADAQAAADRTIADLAAGNLRLRRQWRGCEVVPQTPAGPGEPDAAADDRAGSAARIVRSAAAADAQIRALQAIVESDRK